VSQAAADEIVVRGPQAAHVPLDGSNLVATARDRLRMRHAPAGPVSITLEKNLPVASGIGGGSSDAAAALRVLARHWRIADADALIEDIAPGIGADVPMCLAARPLIARGVGEKLEPLLGFPRFDVVLVNPGDGVPTAQVFATLRRRDNPPMPQLPRLRSVTALAEWLRETRNDLETPAKSIAPRIGEAAEALAAAGAMFARMSGSGATCFGIFDSAAAAERAADAIRAVRPGWFVVATSTGGS